MKDAAKGKRLSARRSGNGSRETLSGRIDTQTGGRDTQSRGRYTPSPGRGTKYGRTDTQSSNLYRQKLRGSLS